MRAEYYAAKTKLISELEPEQNIFIPQVISFVRTLNQTSRSVNHRSQLFLAKIFLFMKAFSHPNLVLQERRRQDEVY